MVSIFDGSRGGLAQSYAHRRKLGGRSLLTTGGNFPGNKGESVPRPLVHQADGMTIHLALSHSFFNEIHPLNRLEPGREGTGNLDIVVADSLGGKIGVYLFLFLKDAELRFHTPLFSLLFCKGGLPRYTE